MELLKRLTMIHVGESKTVLPPATELVAKCCDIADEAYLQFERRGWYVENPSWDALNDAERLR